MKRPQSAKPGYKGNWARNSAEEWHEGQRQEQGNQQFVARKQIKMLKPDLTTNDFARVLPKKIYHDKERLYSEAMQFKQALNQTLEENVKLKTRIKVLEKEKDKITRQAEGNSNDINVNSRIHPGKPAEVRQGQLVMITKENAMVRNLKKMVRQAREQNEFLKQENNKIKKAVKYTKINELEIQRKIILDDNKRLSDLLTELNEQLVGQEWYEKEVHDLKRQLDSEAAQSRELAEANQQFEEEIDKVEAQLTEEREKFSTREKKMQRDLMMGKRQLTDLNRQTEQLRRELKALRENATKQVKKIVQPVRNIRPVSSIPANRPNNPSIPARVELVKKVTEPQEQKAATKAAPLLLTKKQPKQTKEAKDNSVISQPDARAKQKTQAEPEMAPKVEKTDRSQISVGELNTSTAKKHQESKPPNLESPEKKDAEEYDENEFEQQSPFKEDEGKNSEEDVQKLYVKLVDEPNSKRDKKDGAKKAKKSFKPDKKSLSQIKQLLTYRMKAQRYPYVELKKDIQASNQKTFTCSELKQMLSTEPFYLMNSYANTLLEYCYERQSVPEAEILPKSVLIEKLRKVIEQFDLVPEEEEEEMLLRIAEMTSTYPDELEVAFSKIKNGEGTVAKKDLITMFKKLELTDNYIDLIIAELSFCSDSLNFLNYEGFFERFYVDKQENFQNAINEEQLESSGDDKNASYRNEFNEAPSKGVVRNTSSKRMKPTKDDMIDDDL